MIYLPSHPFEVRGAAAEATEAYRWCYDVGCAYYDAVQRWQRWRGFQQHRAAVSGGAAYGESFREGRRGSVQCGRLVVVTMVRWHYNRVVVNRKDGRGTQ
jgi:hypothetical protein